MTEHNASPSDVNVHGLLVQPSLEAPPAAEPASTSAYLLKYTTERAYLAEMVVKERLSDLVKTEETKRALDRPSIFGQSSDFGNAPALWDKGLVELRTKLIVLSGLFDETFYANQFPESLPAQTDPIEHYLLYGWITAKDPHPLFSTRYYLARYPDVRASGIDPLTHYVERGSAEMRDPHPFFHSYYYASQNGMQLPSNENWLAQFLSQSTSHVSPHPIFDVDDYASRSRTDPSSAAEALLHYIVTGWKSGLDASPLFQARSYRSQINQMDLNYEPFTHYSIFGVKHAANPHPLFDVRRYRSIVKDLSTDLDPLIHYVWKGERESVSPSALIDIEYYKKKYFHEIGGRGSFWHYLTEGARRDYFPNPYFDPVNYRLHFMENRLDSDARAPLEHFLETGLFAADGMSINKLLSSVGSETLGHNRPMSSRASSGLVKDIPIPEMKEFPGKLPHCDGRPNVLLVAHAASAHLFGSERSFLDMLDGLASIRANVFAVLPRNIPDYTNMIRRVCERVFVFQYGWWREGESTSPVVRAGFRKIIRLHDISAVHANTIMLRECIEASRDEKVPSVVQVRELITHDPDLAAIIGHSAEDIITAVRSRTDWIIGNSAATAMAFLKPGMTSVIFNTIDIADMDIPNVLDGERVRFGLISSNIPKKGVFDLVEIARRCSITAPNAEFLLIGPESSAIVELRESAKAGQLPPNIYFPGYAASPKVAIAQVHVVLNLSHFAESFGRTVLEAMAARRPSIVYDWGALPELIVQGTTGFLAPLKDVDAVARYVAELCASPGRIAEMGKAARELAVAKYSFHSYRKSFRETYTNILPGVTFDLPRDRSKPMVRVARLPGLKERRPADRIAYFCWHFPVPSETFVLNELRVLVESGTDVVVFCRQSPYEDFKPDFPIQFERVDTPKELADRLTQRGRTIVHAHFVYPTVTNMVWPACELAGIPFTFMAHAQDIFVHKNDENNRLAEIGASGLCLKMFTLSRFHHDFVVERGFPRSKVVINPNAVDTRRFLAAGVAGKENRTARRIVAVHRFVKKKGLSLLIEAAALVRDLGIHVDIYGYGELEAEYREMIEARGITNVTIYGAISPAEVADIIVTADLFACPAIRTDDGNMDGIPTSVVESMVARVPVLTTSISGIADLVEDEITGIICEPNPVGIAEAIRRFYVLPALQVRAIIEEAQQRAVSRHDASKLVATLRRVWQNDTVDIVIVAWNNLRELRMVVDAVLANTALPYHLIICDNMSEKENVFTYLESLWSMEERVTIIHNNCNVMVGPGTNLAMAHGNSDTIIYACAKECVSFRNGWEQSLLHAFDTPNVGLVGTLGYSPSYRVGSEYPTGVRLFNKFRNQAFATENPNRPFTHVQGGLFAMRRRMVDKIGGFSEAVPHDYTDVEYSFYAESCGWTLAEAKGSLALFNKSRPTLSQRFRDDISVAHPVLPHQIEDFKGLSDGRLCHCNICDWFGEAFKPKHHTCPECGSSPADRSLFRWLSDSTLMFRRLPALSVGLSGKMAAVWAEQFQGPRMSLKELADELRRVGRLPNANGRLHLAALQVDGIPTEDIELVATELGRLLTKGATILWQLQIRPVEEWDDLRERIEVVMRQSGCTALPSVRYSSRGIRYSYLRALAFVKE